MISAGSHDTGVMMLKIQLCIAGTNYILKYNQMKKLLTLINCNNISQYLVLLCFWSYKRSLGKQKRHLSKASFFYTSVYVLYTTLSALNQNDVLNGIIAC